MFGETNHAVIKTMWKVCLGTCQYFVLNITIDVHSPAVSLIFVTLTCRNYVHAFSSFNVGLESVDLVAALASFGMHRALRQQC